MQTSFQKQHEDRKVVETKGTEKEDMRDVYEESTFLSFRSVSSGCSNQETLAWKLPILTLLSLSMQMCRSETSLCSFRNVEIAGAHHGKQQISSWLPNLHKPLCAWDAQFCTLSCHDLLLPGVYRHPGYNHNFSWK